MRINNIQKDYGKTSKILKFNHSIDIEPPRCKVHNNISCMICWPRKSNPIPSASSLQRSKSTISDYILCNQFDLFTTFTYDPTVVDSMDENLAKSKMDNWLSNTRRNSPDFKYIVVAEYHKSGAIHFHGVFSGYLGSLTDSKRRSNGKAIYNIDGWHFGFSTATKIEDIQKTSNYIKKYITKEMIVVGNKRRYWSSKNLKKPIKTYNIDFEKIRKHTMFIMHRYRSEHYQTFDVINVASVEKQDPKLLRSKTTRREVDPQRFVH